MAVANPAANASARTIYQHLIKAVLAAAQIDSVDPLEDAIPRLTPRQLQVITLVAEGRSNAEIARALSLQCRTVEAHLYQIYQVLRVPNGANPRVWVALQWWQATHTCQEDECK